MGMGLRSPRGSCARAGTRSTLPRARRPWAPASARPSARARPRALDGTGVGQVGRRHRLRRRPGPERIRTHPCSSSPSAALVLGIGMVVAFGAGMAGIVLGGLGLLVVAARGAGSVEDGWGWPRTPRRAHRPGHLRRFRARRPRHRHRPGARGGRPHRLRALLTSAQGPSEQRRSAWMWDHAPAARPCREMRNGFRVTTRTWTRTRVPASAASSPRRILFAVILLLIPSGLFAFNRPGMAPGHAPRHRPHPPVLREA